MASRQLGVGPAINTDDLVRQVDLEAATGPAFSDTFPLGTGAWTTYTPTWTQGVTVTKTINIARYFQIGRTIIASVVMTATGAGTAGSAVQVTLPIAAADSSARGLGTYFFNDSGTANYGGPAILISSSTLLTFYNGTNVGIPLGTTNSGFTAAIASGDVVGFTVMYEVASGGNPTASPTAAWIDYTPTLTQSATVTKTINYAKYTQIGRMVVARVSLSVTGSGTASNAVEVGLPVAASSSNNLDVIGSGSITDSSASTIYAGTFNIKSANPSVGNYVAGGTSTNVLGVQVFTAALASGDTITYEAVYEAAAGGGIPPVSYAWTDYTPVWTQSATVTYTQNYAKYTQVGRTVTVRVHLSATSAGTAANNVVISLPVAASFAFGACGSGYLSDASTGLNYPVVADFLTSTTLRFWTAANSSAALGATGSSFALAIASSDALTFVATYEV